MKQMFTLKRVLLFIVGGLFLLVGQTVFAGNEGGEKKDIPLKGRWEEDKRSIDPDCPVSVFLDGIYLYVESTSSRSTIHVTLSDGIENVCDETIPAGTCPATLYIGTLESGQTYQLVLTNQFGDHLEGIIN